MTSPVAGYYAWYDASNIATPPADGAALSSWPDLSANAYHLTQATTADQPAYYSSTTAKLVNGLPAVWFNGTSDFMAHTFSPTRSQPITYFLVAKLSSLFTAGAGGYLVDCGSGGSDSALLVDGTTHDFETYASSAVLPGAVQDTNLHIFICYFNGSSSTLVIDATTYSGVNVGTLGAGLVSLGAVASGTSWSPLVACEAIFYNSTLTSTDRTTNHDYLYNKWFVAPTPSAYLPVAASRNNWAVMRSRVW